MIRLRTIKVNSGSRTPYGLYELDRKREMDGKWWHGWFTRPMQKLVAVFGALYWIAAHVRVTVV